MVGFNSWCTAQNSLVGTHALKILSEVPTELANGGAAIAAVIPGHYASEEHIARNLRRLGKNAAADFIVQKLPTSKSIRSGDLGEILATEYISEQTPFIVPIKRLRWKDHRNMAMRGDDVIALTRDAASGRLRFLKTEAKSRASLAAGVIAEARTALDKDNGLPSAHALSFVSARLLDLGNPELADAVDDAQLNHGIQPQSVTHLMFTFSGNNPANQLLSSLQNYSGNISQTSVGLRVVTHASFVRGIYDLVISNANNN